MPILRLHLMLRVLKIIRDIWLLYFRFRVVSGFPLKEKEKVFIVFLRSPANLVLCASTCGPCVIQGGWTDIENNKQVITTACGFFKFIH